MAKRRPSNSVENRMIRNLDRLSAYEEYTEEVLPILQKAISEGWTAEKIEKHPKIQAALVARQLSIALREKDPAKAMAAIKDTRDRVAGKATEKRELKVSYEQMSDEELDAEIAALETEFDPDNLN